MADFYAPFARYVPKIDGKLTLLVGSAEFGLIMRCGATLRLQVVNA
jgi:hypothetical protein